MKHYEHGTHCLDLLKNLEHKTTVAEEEGETWCTELC